MSEYLQSLRDQLSRTAPGDDHDQLADHIHDLEEEERERREAATPPPPTHPDPDPTYVLTDPLSGARVHLTDQDLT